MKSLFSAILVAALATVPFQSQGARAKTKVWTDAEDASLPEDFKLQGEYAGNGHGAHVIALGDGELHVVLYPGGLPGDGWDGKNRSLLAGKIADGKAKLKAAGGNRKYLAKPADQFSASKNYPPEGHKEHSGTIKNGRLVVTDDSGTKIVLKKTVRKSPTLGKRPPAAAKVLFNGSNSDAFAGGRLDEATKLLNTDGKDIRTKDKFSNYIMHIEFMLPYRPQARGQGRGNSGFYQVDHYEVQILDSFGLEGLNNECGGVYTKANPMVNMCFPPLTWQTYDVEFTNSISKDGKKVKNARMTLRHNGVMIHDDLEINGVTGGSRKEPEGTPGPIKLQGHGNPLQFRNVWIVEK
ncbi:MAG: hypothetical protein CMO80_19385 [Verrucomicrobiales bacterium]|nr:hypothetical protein [Verrucomicrobiales bacterium]|tara:strand:- start:200 stop:1252 length:1053 start_codon:yes stop_codon:yes gene_type:complete